MRTRRWWVWWPAAVGVLSLIVLIVVGLVKRQPTIEDCFASLRGLRPVASYRKETNPPFDVFGGPEDKFFDNVRVYEIQEPFSSTRPRLLKEGAACGFGVGNPEWSMAMNNLDHGSYGTVVYLEPGRLRSYDPKLRGLTEPISLETTTSVTIETTTYEKTPSWRLWLAKVGIHV